MAPFDAADLAALAPHECYWRVPTPVGPRAVAARTSALPAATRTPADVRNLCRRLRVADDATASRSSERATGDLFGIGLP